MTTITTLDEAQALADRTPGHRDWNIADWRAAHAWLKGYSDAQLGKPFAPEGTYDPDAYTRGAESARAQ